MITTRASKQFVVAYLHSKSVTPWTLNPAIRFHWNMRPHFRHTNEYIISSQCPGHQQSGNPWVARRNTKRQDKIIQGYARTLWSERDCGVTSLQWRRGEPVLYNPRALSTIVITIVLSSGFGISKSATFFKSLLWIHYESY